MSESLKIRFRLPNGEEFEAEGPQEFIEAQRNYFLHLIASSAAKISAPATAPAPLPAAVNRSMGQTQNPSTNPFSREQRLWQQLLKEEGELFILRRKAHLTVQEAALLILAGARGMRKITQYSALLLSRALKKSGFEPGRLDRLLLNEIKQHYIASQGSKRSRSYSLTPSGFARAFVLAGKRAGETL